VASDTSRALGDVDPLPTTTPTAERPALTDDERAARLRRLAERVRDPDGLDRHTLAGIEQLADDDQ
jgi:hypothetical protein